MTILVVDDEPEYRLIMRSVLMSERRWEVMLAENGEEGIRKLKEMKIDVVISDIYMPVMDGIKFHRSVRAMPEFEKLPFLFVSAYDDQHTLDAVKDPRYEGFLRKARPVGELIEWIDYLMTPEERRSKLPPGVSKLRTRDQLRGTTRGGPGSAIR